MHELRRLAPFDRAGETVEGLRGGSDAEPFPLRAKQRRWSLGVFLLSLASAAQAGRIVSRIRYRYLRKSPGQNSPLRVHSPTNCGKLFLIGNFRSAEAPLRNACSIEVEHLHADRSRGGPSFRRPALNIRYAALSWSPPTRRSAQRDDHNHAPARLD